MAELLSGRAAVGSSRKLAGFAIESGSALAEDQAYSCLCRGNPVQAFQILHQSRVSFGTRSEKDRSRLEAVPEEVAAALPENSVFVSLLAGRRGGAALVLKSGSPFIHSLVLPQFTADAVRALIAGTSASSTQEGSLSQAYRRFNRRLGRRRLLQEDVWRDWDRTLQAALAGLGIIGWNRLHWWLRDVLMVPTGNEVVLSLPSALVSLPIAAVHEPRSGRYFVDDFAVRLIPDAAWLIHCERKAREAERQTPTLLAVLDPGEDLGCDSEWPWKNWQPGHAACEVLAGGGATPARVVDRLPGCTHYVHFGHGSRQRRRAILELAAETAGGPAELDDEQVRALKLGHNRLSILAACESGLSNHRSNGLGGMAGSFLLAGSACVIGCLWPVESSTTRRLVERTLSGHLGLEPRQPKLSPAQALRQAQIELRDSKARVEYDSKGGTVLHLRPLGQRAPATGTICERHLYYWAAFSCLGG